MKKRDEPMDGPANADEVLWERVAAGDHDAFAEVFRHHADRVFAHCLRRLGSRVDADDAPAQVFLAAWHQAGSVRIVNGSVLPWLLVVSTNITNNMIRGDARRPTPPPRPTPRHGLRRS